MQFELNKQQCALLGLNPRAEIHGEEPKPAGDLKIKVALGNDCLAFFAPSLKAALYHLDRGAALDLVDQTRKDDPAYMPHLRFEHLPSFKWADECVGAKVTIHLGIDEKSDIVLDCCNIGAFVLEPMQGGSVIVTFRAQAHPDEHQFGKLCSLIGSTVSVSIEQPKADGSLL